MKKRNTRNFLALTAIIVVLGTIQGCSGSAKEVEAESEYQGVQIGVITYSWRSMPSSPEDIITYCKQTGISSLELMGNIAETFAGMLEYPRYSIFDRTMIRLIMWMTKGPTDPTTVKEYTDWDKVEAFGHRLSAL